MFKASVMATAVAAITVIGVSGSFAAQQLASGAKTSCKTNSTNAAQKAIQMAADPFGVYEFQFTMTYDANSMHVVSVEGMNGYQVGVRNSEAAPSNIFVDTAGVGYVSVRGYWPDSPLTVPQQELDVFLVNFELNVESPNGQLVPTDGVFRFESIGRTYDISGWQSDRFLGVELTDAGEFVRFINTPASQILASGPTFASIPEPSAMGLLGLAALPLVRRMR